MESDTDKTPPEPAVEMTETDERRSSVARRSSAARRSSVAPKINKKQGRKSSEPDDKRMEGKCFKMNDKFDDFLRDYVEIWQLIQDRHRCDILVPFLVLHAFCGACTAYVHGAWCQDKDDGQCLGYEEAVIGDNSNLASFNAKLWALLVFDLLLTAFIFKANNASSNWRWTRVAVLCYGLIAARDGGLAFFFFNAPAVALKKYPNYVLHQILIMATCASNLIIGVIVVGMWAKVEESIGMLKSSTLRKHLDSGFVFSTEQKARYSTQYFYRMLRPESQGFHLSSPPLFERELKSFRYPTRLIVALFMGVLALILTFAVTCVLSSRVDTLISEKLDTWEGDVGNIDEMVAQANEVIDLLEPFATNYTNATNLTIPTVSELAQEVVDASVRLVGQELQTNLQPLNAEMNQLMNLTEAALPILNLHNDTKTLADQILAIQEQWSTFYSTLGALDKDPDVQAATEEVVDDIASTDYAILFEQIIAFLPTMYKYTKELIGQVEEMVPIVDDSISFLKEVNDNLPRSITIGSVLGSIVIAFSLYKTWKGYCFTVLTVRSQAGHYAEHFDLLRKAKVRNRTARHFLICSLKSIPDCRPLAFAVSLRRSYTNSSKRRNFWAYFYRTRCLR